MERIEAAILRTVLYADVFNFPMTAQEIHHFLIHPEPTRLEDIEAFLCTPGPLRELLDEEHGYFVCAGRADLIHTRIERERASQTLWPLARRYGMWLSRLPFVRMVALTGALAVRNAAADDDDLDFLVVTTPGRVWVARAFSIVLVRLGRLRGVEICPNYVLAVDALRQERQDLFIAHEVAQMVPIYGRDLYEQMRAANEWVLLHLPNADGAFYDEHEGSVGGGWNAFKRLVESLLGGGIGDKLEAWEYRRKLQRFATEMQKPHADARLDESHVKGHFNDYGHPVLRKYRERLRQYGLIDATPKELSAIGD
ncbi:MAG: hypothetical protein H7175_24185 [Burkholderiales bacterium]|nr:hypothetical protein [Anaerolineae bacterium]